MAGRLQTDAQRVRVRVRKASFRKCPVGVRERLSVKKPSKSAIKALDRSYIARHDPFCTTQSRTFGSAMPLDQIARSVERAAGDDFQAHLLQARFHNLIESIGLDFVTRARVRARLIHLDAHFFSKPSNVRPSRVLSALRLACAATDEHFKERDHYFRPGTLKDFRAKRAVTFLRNQHGRLGRFLLNRKMSGKDIKQAFDQYIAGGSPVFNDFVGAPDRPQWLTPYEGTIERLCDDAQDPLIGPAKRAKIVRQIVSELGLCHVEVGDEVIGFVTYRAIADLDFLHPAVTGSPAPSSRLEPVGPTPFEARDHRRYRNWPIPPTAANGYGRTYALDGAERGRAVPTDFHGQAEAVRPALPITAFTECIYIGTLREHPEDDEDSAYMMAISANFTLADMLRRLHAEFGV